ncbi:hypothetical protein BGW36DRAFT_365544 [Talaromyces proteolyticus]|uniref:Uncharacterized protein n=1 Tax=Talaromyces proteolyticus TaxID=1131652 RepID=A0AAD4KEA8_9EURO|nr:uncharacterized protein BGW36DRAFT_365544 [Talaromyces proteolyticus]KAH8689010.1 hypothetical protein BGW36DRAFT_365544 [Talaromyces proteolyticus]
MLVVKYRKFELVPMAEGDYRFVCDYEPGWTLEGEQQKPSSRQLGGLDHCYDGWCMLRIGWSRLSEREINRCFAATLAYYRPQVSRTQCQDFLRHFANQFVDRHDLHWRLFIDNTPIEGRSVPHLPTPPAALVQQTQQAQEQGSFMRRVDNRNT